jgi:hypothetical protein
MPLDWIKTWLLPLFKLQIVSQPPCYQNSKQQVNCAVWQADVHEFVKEVP